MEYSLATLMMNIVNDEKLNIEKTILHHKEGVDRIPANIELSAIEVSLVNAMSRELILRSMVDRLREFYNYIIIDCMPSLGMMTINALACADSVLIPVQAAYLPVKGLQQFYNKENLNPQMKAQDEGNSTITVPDGIDAEALMKVLNNPEMAALLAGLAKGVTV